MGENRKVNEVILFIIPSCLFIGPPLPILIPLPNATSRFCGFSMGVTVLLIVTANARVRRRGLDEIFIFFASRNLQQPTIFMKS
jgi:hypothetical protein